MAGESAGDCNNDGAGVHLAPSQAARRGAIVSEGGGYRLCLDDECLDSARFERLAAAGRAEASAGRAERGAATLREALSLSRGPPLADFAFESWAQAEVGRLEEQRLACLEERIDAELACGASAELVGELEVLVDEQSLRERFRGQLMVALYRSGRQAEALAVYQRAREQLVEELGIGPSPELQELHRRILNQDKTLDGPERMEAPSVKLPAPPTPLVGRQRELAELSALLADADVRLVTLVGPGGVGKTRLALATASEVQAQFPQGVFWVPLHALRDPRLVMSTIANVLGSDGEAAEAIGQGCTLFVLDNFEQVVDAAVDVAGLLSACPAITVLVTSREPLHILAEHAYPLSGLPKTDAVALFNERARAIRPDLHANSEVTAICERLDRLPLALELAAPG